MVTDPLWLQAATVAQRANRLYLLLWLVLRAALPAAAIAHSCLLLGAGWLAAVVAEEVLAASAQLSRWHRLLAEEKEQIASQPQQKEEALRAIYRDKGLTGRLLDQVIEVLVSDGRRFLQAILEEGHQLSFAAMPHPLQRGIAAGSGVLLPFAVFWLGLQLAPRHGVPAAVASNCLLATLLAARWRGDRWREALIWNLALLAALAVGIDVAGRLCARS